MAVRTADETVSTRVASTAARSGGLSETETEDRPRHAAKEESRGKRIETLLRPFFYLTLCLLLCVTVSMLVATHKKASGGAPNLL